MIHDSSGISTVGLRRVPAAFPVGRMRNRGIRSERLPGGVMTGRVNLVPIRSRDRSSKHTLCLGFHDFGHSVILARPGNLHIPSIAVVNASGGVGSFTVHSPFTRYTSSPAGAACTYQTWALSKRTSTCAPTASDSRDVQL